MDGRDLTAAANYATITVTGADNDVDLVAARNVDYVEDRAMLQGVLGVFSVHVEPTGSAGANESHEVSTVGLHDHVDILGSARSAVVRA